MCYFPQKLYKLFLESNIEINKNYYICININDIMRSILHILLLMSTFVISLLSANYGYCISLRSNIGSDTTDCIDNQNYVLVITSYASDSKQVSEFMQELEDITNEIQTSVEVRIETLGILSLNGFKSWNQRMQAILAKHNTQYLKAVVLIGQEAWGIYTNLQHGRPRVPFFGCKISKWGLKIPENVADPDKWTPQYVNNQEIAMEIGNGSAIFYDYNINANIKMVKKFFPDTKTIAFLTDNSYGGLALQAKFIDDMTHYHRELDYILIDGRLLSPSEISVKIDSLPQHSALMLGTWKVDYRGAFFTDKSITKIATPPKNIPIFSPTGLGLNTIAIGGIIPQYNSKLSINDFLKRVIAQTTNGFSDTCFISLPNDTFINMGVFHNMNINENLIPNNAKIVDDSIIKLNRYRQYLSITLTIGCIILMMFGIMLTLLYKLRQKNHELNQKAEELINAKKKAEGSDKLKSAFLANISHQIRTPLNAIDGFASIISENVKDKKIKEYSDLISENTEKLLNILTLVIDYAKVDSGSIDFNMGNVDVTLIIETLRNQISPYISNGIRLICQTPYQCNVIYDSEKLQKILSILLDNAIKFTRSGEICIGYFVKKTELTVYVTDTGIGIQESNIHKIFNRFEKFNSFTDGIGIGLTLVKTLIDKSGGQIQIVSRPEAGSRFIITIPCKVLTPESDFEKYDRTNELLNPNTLKVKYLSNPLKILVAKDNYQDLTILKNILVSHNITHVSNAKEIIKQLKTEWYDIILMDIKDEFSIIQKIREFDQETPIIAVTTFEPEFNEYKKHAGCNYILEKPFTRNKVYTAILGLMYKNEQGPTNENHHINDKIS